jgi:5,5'-dehydrodivanillate O-demethylase oxygenase subunit
MISKEENDRFTKLGPGTPLGGLLRRYWYPIAVASSLESEPIQRVRLMGEDLVLFKDDSGRLGLIADRCPHRGASLSYGFTERDGIRCPYHGWLFSADGTCLEQPNQFTDVPALRAQCATTAYRAEILGALVFAYAGPASAPVLPKYDLYTWSESPNRLLDIGWSRVPCNWLQIMENSLDPTHVEWLHGKLLDKAMAKAGVAPSAVLSGKHVKVGFDRFEHGIIKRRLREGQPEDADDWTIGHPTVFPYFLKVGGGVFSSFQMRTPIDDENTLYFWYGWYELPDDLAEAARAAQQLDHVYYVPLQHPDGTFIMDTVDSQDAMVWTTQGRRTDRQGEHLVQGDEGVALFRKQLGEQLAAHEAGKDPMGVFRTDPGTIELPMEKSHRGIGAATRNPLNEFLRTQAKYSKRVNEAVRLIDAKLGLERVPAGIGV